jgi:iron complex outermembrane receptor protein
MYKRPSSDELIRMPSRYRFGAAAVSTLAMMAMATQPAFAQAAATETAPADEAVTDDSGVILVSGIRYGIAKSLDLKRNTDSIIEAVSAEEIGKLPDESIAESIARLPGLAAQRIDGRAQTISLRGFGPDFTTTLLNGRQQASSGDNRSVEFDQYPSELLASAVVYKSPDSHISGMGLAGSVDLRTVRPLAYGKSSISFNIRGELADGGQLNADISNKGWRGTASWIGQSADGTFGWALGFAHLDSPQQVKHYKAYNYEKFGGREGNISPDTADADTFISGQEIWATSRSNKRDAAIGIFEWKPSDSVHSTLDLYYSRFKQKAVSRGAQWFSNVWADAQTFTGVTNGTFGGTTVGVTGVDNGTAPQLRNDLNTRDDHLFSAGLNNEFQLDDKTRFIADLSYSRNKRDESITETYAGYGCCATNVTQNANRTFDSIAWDFTNFLNGTGFATYDEGLNYADASHVSLGDRAPWGGWGHDGATKEPHVIEKVMAIDLGLDHDFDGGFLKNIEVGVNWTHRTKDKRVDEFDLMLKNGRTQTLVGAGSLVAPTSLAWAGMGSVLGVDLTTAIPAYYDKLTFINNDTFLKAWNVREDVITAHAKVAIESGPLHGNLGVQMVYQDQQSSGSAINSTLTPRVVTPVTKGATYTDWLPSLNLIYELGGGHRFRIAASKVIARPRMDQMTASFVPSFPRNPCTPTAQTPLPCVVGVERTGLWTASGGNAELEPWRAKAVDVAYEWYIDRSSYISVNGFYKYLDNYIYNQTQLFDFTGLPIPPSSLQTPTQPNGLPPGVPVSPIGQINQPANGKGGNLRGFEVSGAMGFGKLSHMLDGFGFIGSYSYTVSNLHPTTSTNATTVALTRIPGLSKHVYSLTGYFEKWGFQARASYRYRSGFKGETVQLFATRGVVEILADKQIDAQIGYSFGENSSLNGLSLLLQANNLTDSAFRTRMGVDAGGPKTTDGGFLPETYEKYGRKILVGVGYKF